MKSPRFTRLVAAAFSVVALSAAGCTEKQALAEGVAPATVGTTKPAASIVVLESATPVQVAPPSTPAPTSNAWTEIENTPFDQQEPFFAGLKRLESRVADQIWELKTIRAAMKSTVSMQDWDFAMKEMVDSQSYLKSMGEEASKANSETWRQQKEKVGQAWKRTQVAYEKVKASTTD